MKFFRLICIFLLTFLIVACACTQQTGNTEPKPQPQPVDDGPEAHHFQIGIDDIFYGDSRTVQERLIPWNRNAAQYAIEHNSLYFYFMAGEGTPVEGVGEKIGDSCLVAFPNGKLMLIDANQDGYTPQLVANLKALGVTHLDYVMISHPHSDHYMGLVNPEGLTANFTIGKVYYNGTTSGGTTAITKICNQKGIPMEVLKEGDHLEIGGVSLDVINPTAAVSASEVSTTQEANNSSICVFFTYGDIKALFVGDMYTKETENSKTNPGLPSLVSRYGSALKADLLKIPHHGHSETSILDSFAQAVDAQIAVASSGVALNASVYECYAKAGTKVLGDYMEGYIVVHTDGTKLEYETSRERKTEYYAKLDDPTWQPKAGTTDISSYATGAFFVVETVDELLEAIKVGFTNIRLGADIRLNAYSSTTPLVLNMEGIVLDMDGYSFKGCVSVVADIANKGQTTRCNLQFKGSNFAILNGNFSKSIAGGYVFQINPDSTDPEKNTNIVLDGLASGDGGIDIRGSSVTLRNCNFNQPVGNTQNFTTLMFTDSYVTIESGTYRNKSNYSYKRWLKLFNSKASVKNGVEWDGTVLYSVEDSMLLLEK